MCSGFNRLCAWQKDRQASRERVTETRECTRLTRSVFCNEPGREIEGEGRGRQHIFMFRTRARTYVLVHAQPVDTHLTPLFCNNRAEREGEGWQTAYICVSYKSTYSRAVLRCSACVYDRRTGRRLRDTHREYREEGRRRVVLLLYSLYDIFRSAASLAQWPAECWHPRPLSTGT